MRSLPEKILNIYSFLKETVQPGAKQVSSMRGFRVILHVVELSGRLILFRSGQMEMVNKPWKTLICLRK